MKDIGFEVLCKNLKYITNLETLAVISINKIIILLI